MLAATVCIVCRTSATSDNSFASGIAFSCSRCGEFAIKRDAFVDLELFLSARPKKKDVISHAIRKTCERNKGSRVLFDKVDVIRWFNEASLPKPPEQARNLIFWLGHQPSNDDGLTEFIEIQQNSIASVCGCNSTRTAVEYVREYLESKRLIESTSALGQGTVYKLRLTVFGWQTFDELQTTKLKSRVGFIAMQFGNQNLDDAYTSCFKPAIIDAGFELRRLDEGQGAGLIDDQLRVAIRASKFVLADLTSANRGAYWEAGFAEGLGLPVIYLCQDTVWNDNERRPHFDTNHLVTLIWSQDDLANAQAKLTSIIRNTFPAEAKMA